MGYFRGENGGKLGQKKGNSVFGGAMLDKLSVGDLVSWKHFVVLDDSIMTDVDDSSKKYYGVVTNLLVEDDNDRKVAYAIVLPATKNAKPVKILTMCLNIESKNTI